MLRLLVALVLGAIVGLERERQERAAGLLERLARTLAAGSPEMFIATAGAPRVEPDDG